MEDFVSFEIAKKLKDKGFNYPCIGHYVDNHLYIAHYHNAFHSDIDESLDAPTISQVLKWLREEKEIYCLPFFEQGIDMWLFCIERPQTGCDFAEYISESIYNTYEAAALVGIEYILANIEDLTMVIE